MDIVHTTLNSPREHIEEMKLDKKETRYKVKNTVPLSLDSIRLAR